jgi:Adenylate and Guanylate cyclase catalytic domain
VLFADLKGSMELLADRDPEEARKILDPVLERMMEAVHRYEGTVNQVMGDGIMALFGAPLAHEDHAVRACYAALRMQESIGRYADELRRHGLDVQIRVGLNSGEVVVGSIGSDLRMDYTAVGQTTHLAARGGGGDRVPSARVGRRGLARRGLATSDGGVQRDPSDRGGDREGPGAAAGSPSPRRSSRVRRRWPAVTTATMCRRPPHRGQTSTSMAKEHSSYCTSYTDSTDPAAGPAGVSFLAAPGGCSSSGAYSHSNLSLQRRARRRPCPRQTLTVSKLTPS